MAKAVSRSESLVKSLRHQAASMLAGATVLALSLPVTALAQSGQQASGNRHFTAVPKPPPTEEELAAGGDMIFGIPANLIFFTAVAAIGIFWFTVGGGRKAKLERPQ